MMLRIAFLLVMSSVHVVHSEGVYYSGVDPSRNMPGNPRGILPGEQHYQYYMYNIGEFLSIGCEHDASLTYSLFSFYNFTTDSDRELYKSRFETHATRNLDTSYLACVYTDERDKTWELILYFLTCKAVVKLVGRGLILDDDMIPSINKYSYKFERPMTIEPTCTVSGMMGDYEIRLEGDDGSVAATRVVGGNFTLYPSVSRRFWLTRNSRTINCTVKDLRTNSTKFTSTIDLKYEPDSTTAPSISSSTLSSHPQNQSDYDMCSEASVGQVPGEGSRLCIEKLLVKALMRSALADERQAEAEMRTALAAEQQAEAVQQGVAQGVGLLRDLVTILRGPPPALSIDRGHQV